MKVQAHDVGQYIEAIGRGGDKIRDYLVRSEIDRQIRIYKSKGYFNSEVSTAVKRKFGVDVVLPLGFGIIKDTTNLLWICDAKGAVRRDIVIYSLPERPAASIDKDFMLHARDSVMRYTASDGLDSSYMGTEYNYEPPVFALVSRSDSVVCSELRGLWKMYNGRAMGGPFVCQMQHDACHSQVIAIEGFVFGPGQKKRTALRQTEAIVNSLRCMPPRRE